MKYDTILGQCSKRQIQCVNHLLKNNNGIVYWKMGEGKSRIGLALAEQSIQSTPAIILIVCRAKAFHSWREEILKVGVNWMIREHPKQHGYSLNKPTVWLISHSMLHKCYEEFVYYPIKVIIYDELYLFSNHKTLLSLAAYQLRRALFREVKIYGLSGTVMSAGNNISIFNQSCAVGIGNLLAKNLTDFRTKYQNFFTVNYGHGDIRQYRNKPNSFRKITEKLESHCDFYFPKFSIRTYRSLDIQVDLSDEQKRYIEKAKEEYYLECKELDLEIELRSTLALVHLVSKISNGYIQSEQGRKEIKCSKLEALNNKIEEILGNESKCVIWCYYQSDIDYLKDKIKHPTLAISGSHKFDRETWNTGKVSIVLSTIGVGSSHNDFAQVEYGLYYSQSYKFIDMDQSKQRHSRKSSKHTRSYYYYFMSKNSFDETILRASRQSEQTQNEFLKLCRKELTYI